MKLKKAIKKIIALGTGTCMVGATMMGALAAADLSTYPDPFVKDGVFNALIVVGESAATQDVLGAIDIATSLQYASKTTTSVATGTAAVISKTGDSVKIEKSTNKLEFNEAVNGIQESVTKTDMDSLATGTITNEYGDFDYEQTIYLPLDGKMLFTVDPDDDDSIADIYFFLPQNTRVYQYKVIFTPALKSDHNTAGTDYLEDIRNKKMTLLGQEYTILTASHPAGGQVTLTFMGGAVTDILEEGTSKTYTVEGVDYDVSLDYVSSTECKFTVNGEVSDTLQEGGTYKLADGSEIGIVDIMENEAGEAAGGDRVEFNIGADKIKIEDTSTNVTVGTTSATITIGTEDMSGVKGDIVTASDGGITHGSDTYISWIEINYTPSQDLYVKAGASVADVADLAEDQEGNFFGDGFDFTFEGLQRGVTEEVKLYPSGSNNYKLKWTNKVGTEYKTDVVGRNAEHDYRLGRYTGSAMRDLVTNESEDIADEEYFIVSKNEYSHIMQFKDVSTGSSITDNTGIIKVKDLGTGDLIEVTYTGTGLSGGLNLDGNTFDISLNCTAGAESSSANITVDMDGSGALGASLWSPELFTQYGLNITLSDDPNDHNASIKFTTEKDEDEAKDVIQINFTDSGDNKIDLEGYASIDMTQGSATYTGTMLQAEDGSYLYKWYTSYGMYLELDEIGSGNTQNELTIVYPDEQAFGAFFIESGATTTTTSTGEGVVETTTVTKIDVGAAVLDTDPAVSGHETEKNLIVVGGPAINKAAAVLLGLPFPSYGAASTIPENAALIKLVEQTDGTVAVIVAGWTADDSQRSSRVLADFATYQEAGTLTGTEVQVTGTSLTDITVSAPTVVEEEVVEEEVVEEETVTV